MIDGSRFYRVDILQGEKLENRVSIVIPVFNTPIELLERSIGSALIQDGVKEIIIIDDGSDSLCANYLDSLAQSRNNKLVVIHQTNKGVSSARNAGLKIAAGEYVAFADSDDELDPCFIKSALRVLSDSGADIALGSIEYFFADGSMLTFGNPELGSRSIALKGREIEALMGSIFNGEAMTRINLQPAMYVSNCAALYKRDVIKGIFFREDIAISEDRLFNFEAFGRSSAIALTGDSWYRYGQNQDSASQKTRKNAQEEMVATAEAFEGLLSNSPDSVRNDILLGIVECFNQALEFTVLKKDFRKYFKMSKIQFIKNIMEENVYQRTFNSVKVKNISYKLLIYFFKINQPRLIYLLSIFNKFLFNLKHR